MAEWEYGDWRRQVTKREQLDRLNLFLEEIQERIDAERSSDGHSRSSNALLQLLTSMESKREALQEELGDNGGDLRINLADLSGAGS